MAKLTLKDITSGFLATQVINDNNALIEALVENFLSRDGLAPNTMLATLDMNSNRIINTTDPVLAQDAATKNYVDSILAAGIADQGGNAGLFLTTDGSTTSWADPLPDQTGEAGNFLTTNGTIAAWQAGTFLPDPLVANRLVSNDGATPSWRLDFLLTTNTLAGDNTNAGALLNVAASSTVPTVVGDKADPNSGLTLVTLDEPGIVSGGVLAVSWAEASSGVLQRSQMTVGITANPVQTQGNTPLFSSYNEISVAANTGDVVTLPAAFVGQIVTVVNNGANDVAIFPASGEDLGAGVDTSVALSSGGTLQLLGTATGTYVQAFNLGLFGDFSDTQFCASNPNGPCMQNEASSLTNPTFIPDRTDVTSGLGGSLSSPVAIIALGATVATFNASGTNVNFFTVQASDTGDDVALGAEGADADILLGMMGKGAGGVALDGGQSLTVTADGGLISITSGDGGSTSGDSGDVSIATGEVTDGSTGDITLSTANATIDGEAGDLFINLGTGAGANNGGDFNVTAGTGGLDSEGGFIELDAGAGNGTAGGGGFTARGGIGGMGGGTGGQIFIQAGLGGTNGAGGALDLFGGPGSNAAAGGITTLQGGNAGATSGDGGALLLQGGQVFAGTGNSGAVTLRTRASGTAPGNSGSLTIETGSSVGGTVGDILFNLGGIAQFELDSTGFRAANASGPILVNEASSTTNPTLIPERSNLSTGISAVAGELSFINDGLESIRIDASGAVSLRQVGGSFLGSNTSGPRIDNVASSGSVATIRPNRGTVAGIGGTGGTVDIITGAGLSGLRVGTGPGNVNTVVQPSATSGLLLGSASGSFGLHNLTASATVPTLLPSFLTETAGIGANVAGSVSLITSSLERLRVDATGNVIQLGPRQEGSVAGSYAILNELASGTNPTLCPNKADQDTGIGQDVAGRVSIIGNGVENMRVQSGGAGDTRFLIFDEDNSTLERVTVGAADSGGVGFKVLRIPN